MTLRRETAAFGNLGRKTMKIRPLAIEDLKKITWAERTAVQFCPCGCNSTMLILFNDKNEPIAGCQFQVKGWEGVMTKIIQEFMDNGLMKKPENFDRLITARRKEH